MEKMIKTILKIRWIIILLVLAITLYLGYQIPVSGLIQMCSVHCLIMIPTLCY